METYLSYKSIKIDIIKCRVVVLADGLLVSPHWAACGPAFFSSGPRVKRMTQDPSETESGKGWAQFRLNERTLEPEFVIELGGDRQWRLKVKKWWNTTSPTVAQGIDKDCEQIRSFEHPNGYISSFLFVTLFL